MTQVHTIREVAASLRCSPRKVSDTARTTGVGMQLGGRAGWRFTDDDVVRIREALSPAPVADLPARRRRRRRAPRQASA